MTLPVDLTRLGVVTLKGKTVVITGASSAPSSVGH